MNTNGDDELVTLDAALAFINSCEEEAQEDAQPPSAKALDIHDVFTLEGIDDLKDDAIQELLAITKTSSPSGLQSVSPTTSIKKKRVRNAASSSTVLQRRKKAEIETLRDEIARLEGYLTQLSSSGPQSYALAVTEDDGRLSEWHRHALLQYQQRHMSEQMNRRLKELLEHQWKISSKLRGILHRRNVLDGMEFVRTFESPSCEGSYFTTNHTAVLLDQLEGEVDGVYRNFHHIYRPHIEPTVNCTSQVIYNEKCDANVMEITTKTPLDWPMHAAFKNVWEFLESSSDRSRKPNTLEAKINLTLPHHNRTSSHFNKLHLLRKYEEKDRIVIVWADIIQMTSRKIRLRTVAHAVFSQSEIDPSNACVMETFLKLYVEPISAEEVSSEDIRYGQEVVLGTIGRLMRKFWQNEQNRLVDVTSNSFVSV
ncbi:hypothetical protein V7S43_004149 [Phytophthora oleae]|uniref:BZIP domain-containing protein n=1 Tax=Phytophthora oleae TaxID=2107226 RepID=A0ABD3FXM1_9STRA